MPTTLDELVALLDLDTVDDDLYRGRQPIDSHLVRVYGGQVLAQALKAACLTVAATRPVHSLHSYFLLGGDPSLPIDYEVERIRDGGSFSTRRVTARQRGDAIFSLMASFQKVEDGFTHQETIPDVLSVEEALDIRALVGHEGDEALRRWEHEWAALDLRFVADDRAFDDPDRAAHPARQRLWFRAKGDLPDDDVLHRCVLTYLSDLTLLASALVPHGVNLNSSALQAATLDHTIWFHRPVRADAWHLYDQVSPAAGGARGLGTGRVFAQDGTLVASVAQEGLIRPVVPRPAPPPIFRR